MPSRGGPLDGRPSLVPLAPTPRSSRRAKFAAPCEGDSELPDTVQQQIVDDRDPIESLGPEDGDIARIPIDRLETSKRKPAPMHGQDAPPARACAACHERKRIARRSRHLRTSDEDNQAAVRVRRNRSNYKSADRLDASPTWVAGSPEFQAHLR
jgi:hypothetical protein